MQTRGVDNGDTIERGTHDVHANVANIGERLTHDDEEIPITSRLCMTMRKWL